MAWPAPGSRTTRMPGTSFATRSLASARKGAVFPPTRSVLGQRMRATSSTERSSPVPLSSSRKTGSALASSDWRISGVRRSKALFPSVSASAVRKKASAPAGFRPVKRRNMVATKPRKSAQPMCFLAWNGGS